MHSLWLGTAALLAAIVVYSCSSNGQGTQQLIIVVNDVTVEIQGEEGTPFEGLFKDDDEAKKMSGTVPFTVDFADQAGFFEAIVDKGSGGAETVCVKVTATNQSKESCTVDPFGRVSTVVVFD